MPVFHGLILGLVQGLGEFLPISSSAHLILVPWFFGWEDPGLAFDVFLHLGTLLAVGIYFFRDWLNILRAGIASIIERRIGFERDRMMFWLLVIATIPGVLAGVLFAKHAEESFRHPELIAMTLSGVGFLLYWVDGKYASLKTIEELRMKDALLIGIAQAFAIIPGVSRSGSTMGMGRFRGLSREAAARFSFLMSVPITFGACLFEARKFLEETTQLAGQYYLFVGLAAAFASGITAIHFLMQYLRHADFRIFAWYRVGLGAVIIVVYLVRTYR